MVLQTRREKWCDLLFFVFFGPLLLLVSQIFDIYTFFVHSYRTDIDRTESYLDQQPSLNKSQFKLLAQDLREIKKV